MYIHTVTQAIELPWPTATLTLPTCFVDVPLDILLSKAYAAERRAMMTDRAFGNLPSPGVIPGYGSRGPVMGKPKRFHPSICLSFRYCLVF